MAMIWWYKPNKTQLYILLVSIIYMVSSGHALKFYNSLHIIQKSLIN